jgi:hypothetical protein
MALINPLGVYTGGNVVFNSNPYTAFATNMMQRKAARDEAMDNYYRDLNKSINPAGVRTQDINGFMQRTNALQDYWQKNRDAIKNPRLDNGASQTEYNSRYQDIQGYINSSKQAELQKKPFVDALSDPDKRERVSDRMLYDVHLHDLPLDDQNRKQFDITQEDFNPKQMTSDDWQKYYKGVGEGITPDKNDILITPSPTDKFTNIETTVARYTPEKLQTIGNLAKTDYDSDHRLQYNFNQSHPFKDWKQEHEGEFNKYNSIYQQIYGKDIQDDRDLHSAIVLSKKIEPTSIAKTAENRKAISDYNFAHQKELEGIRFAHQQALARLRKSLGLKEDGSDDDGLWIDGYVKNKIDQGKAAQYYDKNSGKWIGAKEISLDPISEQSLKVNGQSPDFVYAMPDGNLKYGIYRREVDKAGKPTGDFLTSKDGKKVVDMTNVRTISQPELKAAIAKNTGVKHFNQEMSSGGKSQAAPNKTPVTQDGYSRDELKAAGWSDEQIKVAIKAGKIKVHD